MKVRIHSYCGFGIVLELSFKPCIIGVGCL
jgi:hypothetical protein